MDGRTLTRRAFVGSVALAGGALTLGALGGCSWTPRSEAQGVGSAPEASWEPPAAEMEFAREEEAAMIDDELVRIEGGAFVMGSPLEEDWRGEDEAPHEVRLGAFYLAPYEVTQQEYERVMGENPSSYQSEATAPVEGVSWADALAFCNRLSEERGLAPAYEISEAGVRWDRSANGYRLPTEAEWEYACRAGTVTPFYTEHPISADDEANYYGTYPYEIEENYFSQGQLETAPGVYREHPVAVGSFPANPWGLFDMHGNVAEWMWDFYGPYDVERPDDPTGPEDGSMRVVRGGAWNDFGKNVRSAYRAALMPETRNAMVGFRVARNDKPGFGVVGSGIQRSTDASGEGLIVFYTWGGNTGRIAQEVARQTGFQVVELEMEEPYSSDYNTVLEQAQHDQNVQARPALRTRIEAMEGYGTVLVGYPNWWASIPMPVATFLESYDFSGKTLVPFCSNGGGRLGQSVSAIGKLAPTAVLGEGLSVYYGGGASLPDDVAGWLERNGVL